MPRYWIRCRPFSQRSKSSFAPRVNIGFFRLPIGGHSTLEVVTVHRERFVLVVPASHKLEKRRRVRLSEVSGQNFVFYERTHTHGFHDLVFGMLRDAGIVPNKIPSVVTHR
ncbi:MAG TPA: LysR substrate-binding domain-containing protein [Terriglobales bacterium]|nr:LysR substrate-binding domain-containing protein [Terriglobales bacterium]